MAQYELNLRDYWQIIRKRREVLITIFLSVFCFFRYLRQYAKPGLPGQRLPVHWMRAWALGSLLTELVQVETGDPFLPRRG